MSKSKDTQTNNTQTASGNKKSKGYQKAIEFAIILLFFGVAAILASVLFLSKEMANKPGLRVLFDASRNLSEDSLKMFAEMINTYKKTNPDG